MRIGALRPAKTLLLVVLSLLSLSSLFSQGAPEPRRFAMAVGINQYADPGILPLQKAQNDAEDLAAALGRLGGFKAVTVMSGSLPYGDVNFPSKNKIIERVEALAAILRPDDQVLFFFSGHGINDKAGDSYLLPIDAQIKDPTGSGINVQRDIAAKFEASGIKNLFFLVDACQKTIAKDKGLLGLPVGVNQVKPISRAVVITSTDKGKASYEDPKGPNGIFTRSILAALNGEGDLNRDGLLSLPELERYLPDAVSEYAFTVGLSQKPAIFDEGSGILQPALVRLGSVPGSGSVAGSGTTPGSAAGAAGAAGAGTGTPVGAAGPSAKAQFVQFKLPEGLRVDLRLLSADGREIKSWPDCVSFSEKLEPGSYRVEAQDRSYLYYAYSASFIVAGAKVVVPLDLKPNFGSLALSCDPSDGVEILLNGQKRGSLSGGSLILDGLKSGGYELVLVRELYDTKRLSIQIEDGKVATVKASLSPNFFTLSLSERSGAAASLFVDGQDRGKLPLTIQLPFRDSLLRVVPSDSRYKEWSETLKPKAKGGTEKLVAALVGRTGFLEVTTSPDLDAELALLPTGGGPVLKIGTAPLDYEALIGDYELSAVATKNGKKLSASAKLSIREGQTSSLRMELKDATPALPATPALSAGMVYVPGGTFMMGSPANEAGRSSNETQHQVSLSPFAIAATDVTVGEFRAFVNATGYKTSAELNAGYAGGTVYSGGSWVTKPDASWKNPYYNQTDSYPVVLVSWYDAVAFCNWRSQVEGKSLAYRYKGEADFKKWPSDWNTKTHNDIACDFAATGYRLPTEAEWEYAAKGGPSAGSLAVNAVYAGSASIDDVAWYSGNSGSVTHPMAQKKANTLGLYDMAGNVWQWCQDWYGSDYYGKSSAKDPRGPDSGDYRVLRGGSWRNVASYLRSAIRDFVDPWYRGTGIGFRLLCPQIGQGGASR